ncbi:MAG: hypothetical protein RL180_1204 [Pseudomonadota bacterium]|jgi:uncharacterized protein (DUF2147 family)
MRTTTGVFYNVSVLVLALGASHSVMAAKSEPAEAYDPSVVNGVYRSVDDKTGFSRGLTDVHMKNGELVGYIVKTIPRPGYTPKTHCTGCPAPYTNQPIVGLQVISGMKPVAGKAGEFSGGHLLDPVSGNLYKGTIKLSNDHRKLKLRGYIGLPIMGRTQWWMREEHPERY